MSVTELERTTLPDAASPKPVVNIGVMTPKPGKFEEFMELQLAQHWRLRDKVQGVLGGRFRSLDDRSVVLVTVFATAEDAQRWREDQRFADHLARVRPLLESAVPGTYQTAYEVGVI